MALLPTRATAAGTEVSFLTALRDDMGSSWVECKLRIRRMGRTAFE
jgi:hypothetical protein